MYLTAIIQFSRQSYWVNLNSIICLLNSCCFLKKPQDGKAKQNGQNCLGTKNSRGDFEENLKSYCMGGLFSHPCPKESYCYPFHLFQICLLTLALSVPEEILPPWQMYLSENVVLVHSQREEILFTVPKIESTSSFQNDQSWKDLEPLPFSKYIRRTGPELLEKELAGLRAGKAFYFTFANFS